MTEYLQNIFPDFDRNWIKASHVWKARYSQAVVTINYNKKIPGKVTPIDGVYIATMAQIYPEDRGTNHAIRDGTNIAQYIINK